MNINFKNYEYDGAWYGKEMIDFHGQTFNVDVQIDSYDEEIIPEDGRNALPRFVNKLNDYTTKIAESIFKYYCKRRYELGYSEEVNADYPVINSLEEIFEMITLIGITVPYQDDYDEPAVSLAFDCTWDRENGVGVCFIGENIDDIVFQDIALY